MMHVASGKYVGYCAFVCVRVMLVTYQFDALWKGIVLPVFLRKALENVTLALTASWRKREGDKGQVGTLDQRAKLSVRA